MANILVTGGAGYIGSHTCKLLAASGHTPIVYDNLSNGHRDAVRWGPFEAGDITDGERLREVIRAHEPQSVIHFAGLIEVGISVADPTTFYQTNVNGSLTLLRAMVDEGVGSLVFSSTAAVYGQPKSVPIPEEAPCAPINPYGATKRAVEEMLGYFATAHGLRYAALRYFNRGRRRSRRRSGRASRSREPSHSAGPIRRARSAPADRYLRYRLSDTRRHGGARLCSCERSCERACGGPGLSSEQSGASDRQSRHWYRLFGAPGRRYLPAYCGARHTRAGRAAPRRRSAATGGGG